MRVGHPALIRFGPRIRRAVEPGGFKPKSRKASIIILPPVT